MNGSLSRVEVITLFVDDIARSREFYDAVFARPIAYEDDVSFVLQFENLMVNCLQIGEATVLVDPQTAATPANRSQMMVTIPVENADATCAMLRKIGVELLNGPIDRPWGRRTAAFSDPSGHVWEIAQIIDGSDDVA